MGMKRLALTTLITFLVVMGLSPPVVAEMATMDDASTVANNWITLIIEKNGDWGGSETAEVEEIREFKRGERVIGYFCHVEPQGFIVISLYKELAPVKAYSATCDLDPASDEGMADVIKIGMAGILNAIEQQIGPVQSARTQDVENILETNHRLTWDELGGNVETFKVGLESGVIVMNYEEGEVLLSLNWHQQPPYNDDCPDKGCNNFNHRALVGCVATAGAQIMRYWSWPPYGSESPYNDGYDWSNMPDSLTTSSPHAQIDAVAELCYEVGKAAGTDYGCDDSTAWLGGKPGADMTDAYKDHFRYNENTDFEQRWHYSDKSWFDIIKTNINKNRPLQYGIMDNGFAAHSMVCDGWEVVGSTRMCHMNYGWSGTSSDTWYNIDNLPGAEGMIRKIKPAPSLGSWLSGTYTKKSFPYRYFDQDATGHDAVFKAGQYLQFLPSNTVKCTSPDGGKIQFIGWSTGNTHLFTRGDVSKGIRIHSGHIYLCNPGSIKFQ
jgi:hypothetical protein